AAGLARRCLPNVGGKPTQRWATEASASGKAQEGLTRLASLCLPRSHWNHLRGRLRGGNCRAAHRFRQTRGSGVRRRSAAIIGEMGVGVCCTNIAVPENRADEK